MSVVNIEFRASANFSELTAQVNRANASVMGLNATLNKVNGEKLADAFASFERGMVGSGKFTAATTQVISNTEKFGKALAQQKLTLSEYHRATSDFIRGRESQIKQLAMQQVAMDRSMVVTQGHTVGGQVRATVFTPTSLNETATKAALASKQMQIFNKVLNDGATSIINWGKNTQWAGRQLTVGLTLPLTLFGAAAGKAFMEADKQLVRLVKVYGDANTNLTNQQTAQLRASVMNLGKELASAWGVSINETLGLAADFAAVGKQGDDLIASTRETSRLMVLGEIDRQTAMKTTLSIQSAFKESNVELADSINFLNAVENQTSATLEDLTTVIPKAGPVVRGLGGDVKDLALMFVAMKEGGVPAAESANAIKSGLASLINPTKKATEFLADYNINITKIIEKNQGKIVPTLLAVKEALDGLDPLNRSRAIEMMFGKFQFARISALFDNLGRAGSQTAQVMNLMGASTQQLAQIADRELKVMTESASGRWNRAIESIKANMAILGESILPIGTFFMNVADKIVSAFNSIPEGVKSAILILGGLVAIAGPVIMITGVLANFGGYIIKLIAFLRNLRSEGRGAFEYLTPEVKAAKEAGDLLSIGFDKATSSTDRMAASINELIISLQALAATQNVTAVESAGASALGRNALAQAKMMAVAGAPGSSSDRLRYILAARGDGSVRREATGLEFSHFAAESSKDISGLGPEARNAPIMGGYVASRGSGSSHAAALLQQAANDRMAAHAMFLYDETDPGLASYRRSDLLARIAAKKGVRVDQVRDATHSRFEGDAAPARIGTLLDSASEADLARMNPSRQEFIRGPLRAHVASITLAENLSTKSFKALSAELAKAAQTQAGTVPVIMAALKAAMGSEYDLDVATTQKYGRLRAMYEAESAKVGPDAALAKIFAQLGSEQQRAMAGQASGSSWLSSGSKDTKKLGAMVAVDFQEQALAKTVSVDSELNTAKSARAAAEQQLATLLAAEAKSTSAHQVVLNETTGQYELALRNAASATEATVTPSYQSVKRLEAINLARTDVLASEELIQSATMREAQAREAAAAALRAATASTQVVTVGNKQYTLLMNANNEVLAAWRVGINGQRLTTMAGTKGMENLLRVINNTILAEERLAVTTDGLATARQKETVAAVENTVVGTGKSGGMFGGRGKMMGAMGALGMLSMIPMMLPDTGNASLDTGKSALSGAGMGAMMGMMLGPVGAGVGAAIGGAIPLVTKLIDKMGEAERTYVSLTSVGEAASSAFGVSIRKLSDINMKDLVGSTDAAAEAVNRLKEAFDQAADGSQDKNFIDALKSADDLSSVQGLIRDKTITLLESGATEDQIKQLITAALMSAGKEGYSLEISAYVKDFQLDKGSTKIMQDKINDAVARGSLDQLAKTSAEMAANQAETEAILSRNGNRVPTTGADSVRFKELSSRMAELQSAYGNLTLMAEGSLKEISEALSTAAVNMPIDKFMELAGSLNTSAIPAREMVEALKQSPGASDEMKAALDALIASGASTEEVLQGIALKNAGVISSWKELGALPPAELLLKYNILVEQQQFVGDVKAAFDKAMDARAKAIKNSPAFNKEKAQAAAEAAQERRQAEIQSMQDAAQARQDMFSEQKDAIKERYDAEIQKIKEAEDARQKAFDHQKKIADRQKTLFGLQVGYREALAEGNFGAAAIARNDMATAQKQWSIEDSSEASKSATEKRIAALEKERDGKVKAIEAAAKADKKASDDAIKNAQAAAKAAQKADAARIKSAEAAGNKIIDSTGKWKKDFAAAVELSKTNFEEGMNAMKQVSKTSGVDFGTLVKSAFIERFGSTTGGTIWSAFKDNLTDAPWDLLNQLAAARLNNDTTTANAVMRQIGKWKANLTAPHGGSAPGGSATSPSSGNHLGGARVATGGYISGPGGPREDKIPAWLSNGEFVVKADSVSKYGLGLLHAINAGRYADGGLIQNTAAAYSGSAIMGMALAIAGGKLTSSGGSANVGTGISGDVPPSDNNISGNRALGKRLAGSRGWGSGSQWNALNYIFDHESGWSTTAYDPGQGDRRDPVDPRARLTWGIPQANPAHKMASAGPDWFDNPETQIKWGLGYIKGRYTDPLGAYAFGRGEGRRLGRDWGWYADGGLVGIPKNAKFHRGWVPGGATPAQIKAAQQRLAYEISSYNVWARKHGKPTRSYSAALASMHLGQTPAWIMDVVKKSRRPRPSGASNDTGGSGIFAIAPVGTRTVTNGKTYNGGGAHAEKWRDYANGGVNDIDASFGTPFHALLPGVVEYAAQGYYYPPGYVIVKNTDGSRIRYAHARVLVKPGDHVRAGDVVGTASTTNAIPIKGRSMTSPHLHFAWLGSRKLIQREHGYVPWLDDKGKMIKFANGGEVSASLLTGEHVMNRGASAKYGRVLEAMNNQRYHTGGVVTPSGPKRDTFASAEAGAYNVYNIDVDARGSDLSPQAVADLVMKGIEAKDKRKGGPRK